MQSIKKMNARDVINLQEAYLEVYNPERLDEARITRAMGRRADEYNKKREQDAYMQRLQAHRERMKNDPEYRENHERLSKIHSRNEEYDDLDVDCNLDEGREGGRFEYNQRHGRPLIDPAYSQRRSETVTLGGGTYQRGPKRLPKSKRKYDQQVLSGVRAASDQEKQRARKRMGIGEDYDVYDVVLSHLLDEGYADSVESAETIMVNMSEDWRDSILEDLITEISLKTKLSAYARTQDPDADYSYGDKVHDQGARIRDAIVKKHGTKAGEHADAHADSQNYGRTDPRTGKKQGSPVPRSSSFSGQNLASQKRTTKSGKMNKTDQKTLKTKLQNRRTSRRQGESSVTDHPSFYNR